VSFESIYGRITSNWRQDSTGLYEDIEIPANTTAEVSVPANRLEDVFEAGRAASKSKGVHFLRMENGAAVFELASGTYLFHSKRSEIGKVAISR
jgi:alpha-L-rhamnosidase